MRYERLRDEVARLSSPSAVIAAAEALGMKLAAREIFINAPAAAPRGPAGDAVTVVMNSPTYDKTKQALDQNP